MKRKRWFKVPLVVLFVVLAVTAASFAVMLLWNAVIPGLFHGPFITFWQSMGLLVLSKILFGRFGPRRHSGWHGHQREHWRRRFEEKMASMTPEEREKFKSNCRNRFGRWDREDFENKTAKDSSTVSHGDEGKQ